MPNLFARTTPLPNIAGRLDYIANPKRQENLLAVHDSAESLLDGQYWKILAQECQAAFAQNNRTTRRAMDRKNRKMVKKTLKCREGREMMLLLSNTLLDRMDASEIARILSEAFEAVTGIPNRVSIHYNKTKKSLHAHVIFAERHLLEHPEIKIATRNLYFDSNGKRRYRKSDIMDDNGQLLPGCRICKKGDVYQQHYFSSADTKIQTPEWLKHIKTDIILQLRNGALKGDIEITEYDPSSGKLAQQYIAKGVDDAKAASMRDCNEMVKTYNGLIDAGRITHDEAMKNQEEFNRQADRNAYLAAKLEEIRLRERRERERRATAEKATVYSRPDWCRSTNGQPYRIRRYDEHGRKRSLIELVAILAMVTIENEFGRGEPTSSDSEQDTNIRRKHIYAKKDIKVQAMIDTIRVAREEGLENPFEIDERIQQAGKELSKARAEARRLSDARNRMDEVAKAIADCERLSSLCERIYAMPDDSLDKQIQMAQYATDLTRYKEAKATIYRAGIASPEAREALLARYRDISAKAAAAETAMTRHNEQYSRLIKLRYNVQMAQSRQYCFDLDYCPEPPEEAKDPQQGMTPNAKASAIDFRI